MRLLLLLSAMLSVLSGMGAQARTPQAAVAVAGASSRIETASATAPAAAGGITTAASMADRAGEAMLPLPWRLVPAVPTYLNRRRE